MTICEVNNVPILGGVAPLRQVNVTRSLSLGIQDDATNHFFVTGDVTVACMGPLTVSGLERLILHLHLVVSNLNGFLSTREYTTECQFSVSVCRPFLVTLYFSSRLKDD